MKVDKNVNWQELARSTDEFGGAQLKAVCVEAGMIALRTAQVKISHEHYVDAIAEVQAKKKDTGKFCVWRYFHWLTLPSEFLRMMWSGRLVR
jgi:26S proteasome regulatory subunit T5